MSIRVEHINKRFGNFTALNDVSVYVPGGSLLALLGPSGAGKSSLLRATQRLIEHGHEGWRRSGDVLFNEQSVFGPTFSKQQLARRILERAIAEQQPRQ